MRLGDAAPGSSRRRLVLAGEALVDIVMGIPGLPERGGDVLATRSEITVGGGFNVMAAAARQGMPVLYAGGHGTGPWGDLVRAALAVEGVEVLRLPDPARDTGFDVALVEPDGERSFVTRLGAEALREPGSWDAVPLRDGDLVYVSGYGLVPEESGPVLGEWAARLPDGVLLFLDPGPLVMQVPTALLGPVLDRCDWLSCNAREAIALAGEPEAVAGGQQLTAVARQLRSRAARASVLVRDGAAGCLLAPRIGPDRLARLPPGTELPAASVVSRILTPEMAAVDTTGAGDAHSGVFLAGLAEGRSPARAAGRANVAAAISVTRYGPATAPGRAEIDAWLTARGLPGDAATT